MASIVTTILFIGHEAHNKHWCYYQEELELTFCITACMIKNGKTSEEAVPTIWGGERKR